MFKNKGRLLLSLIALTCFYSLGQDYEYEYDCDGDVCEIVEKPAIKNKKSKENTERESASPYKTLWISDNLDVDFGDTLAETTRLLLKRMDLEHHEQNFARCFDTTQSFLLCYSSSQGQKNIEQLKQQKGLLEGGKYYGKDFFIYDVTARACNDLGIRIAIFNKSEPNKFMGYVEFATPHIPDAGAPVQIYLLPEFRGQSYAEEALNVSISYISQLFGKKYASLDSNPAYRIVSEVAERIPGANLFVKAQEVKPFLKAFSKAIAHVCKSPEVKKRGQEVIFDKIWAEIRKDNHRSIDLFTKAGFCLHHSDFVDNYYEYPCKL